MSSASSNVENLSPQTTRIISKELQQLAANPPEGIKVLINEEDFTDIQALIDGPAGTPYYGGQFRVRLILGKDFPQSPPKGFFITKIFHPNVARNGEICVNTLKKDWKSDLGIKHILLTIKCLLIVPNPESALNEEAGKMLLEQYDDYCRRAKMMTEIHAAAKSDKHDDERNCENNDACSSKSSTSSTSQEGRGLSETSSGQPFKKHAGDKAVQNIKTKGVGVGANSAKTKSITMKRLGLKRL